MLIALAGLPGSGKSTIAGQIGERLRAAVVSVDPIEAAILEAGIDGDQPTGLAAYLVAGTIAQSVLAAGHTIVVDAVNAVNPAREQWVAIAEQIGASIRFVEAVCSDDALYRERLIARQKELTHLGEPNWHAVEQSLEEYDDWTGPSGAVPRITLDTSKSMADNVDAAVAFLENATGSN